MSDRAATTVDGTVAQVFRNGDEAEGAARDLRAAGFSDVRISEGAGTTTEAHVPASAGLTATDFAATLRDAGFADHDARRLTEGVARGGTLVTLAAGGAVERALAVLRGEAVARQSLSPVGGGRSEATPAAAEPSDAERTLELREERLEVRKGRAYGEARVRKETITEQRTITVPVQREQLVVERDGEDPIRIPISGDAASP